MRAAGRRPRQPTRCGGSQAAGHRGGDGCSNPVDLAVAAGRFYGGHRHPYVPGCEAVGRRDVGTRVYVFGDGRGTVKEGFLAERVDVPAELDSPVPDGIEDAVAASCWNRGHRGWIPVATKARGSPG